MTKFLKFGILLLTITLMNCSKSTDDEATENNSSQIVKATLDGQAWTATKITSANVIRYASLGRQRFDIIAEDAFQRISISCEGSLNANNAVDIKTYTFDSESEELGDALFTNVYIVGSGSIGFHIPRTGILTITSVNTNNKTISGTFSFTSERNDSPAVTSPPSPLVFKGTNGVFTNVKYTVFDL